MTSTIWLAISWMVRGNKDVGHPVNRRDMKMMICSSNTWRDDSRDSERGRDGANLIMKDWDERDQNDLNSLLSQWLLSFSLLCYTGLSFFFFPDVSLIPRMIETKEIESSSSPSSSFWVLPRSFVSAILYVYLRTCSQRECRLWKYIHRPWPSRQ